MVMQPSPEPWQESPNSFADFERGDHAGITLSAVRLLAPAKPSKIVCIGRNYREHAKELNHPIPTEPLIFLEAALRGDWHGRRDSTPQCCFRNVWTTRASWEL